MPCCKCEEHHWRDPQPVTYTDEAGQEYCLFHAPAEHKGMAVGDFNVHVFARIATVNAKNLLPDNNTCCDLSGTVFPGEITLEAYGYTKPLTKILFTQATFNGRTSFTGVKFGSEAIFRGARFNDLVDFRRAIFSGKVNFSKAEFGDKVFFVDATFSREANFILTVFKGETNFHSATFSEVASFFQVTFDGETYFRGPKADKNAIRMELLSTPSLANLHFTSMDTACFSFKGCMWPEKLWPETHGRTGAEVPDYKACEELYRSLKQKAADEHDQPMVSKWHYREKLMALEQIKARRGWRGRFGLTGLYYWCSGFGEDPAQAFRILVGMLLFSLLALCGFKLWETGIGSYRPDWTKVLEIPAELLMLIPFVKQSSNSAPAPGGLLGPAKAIFASLMHIVFAAQIALFAFALRNRFRR